MNALDKFSKEQIREITGMIDDESHTCHINGETGEVIFLLFDDVVDEWRGFPNGDEDDGASDNEPLSWQDEALAEEEANIAKVNSWGEKHTILIEKPESREAFDVMCAFVQKSVPEGRLRDDLEKALSRKHPFRNFKAIIDNSRFREAWFAFKQEAIEDYVREKIRKYAQYNEYKSSDNGEL